jgi:hypothetical protein
MEKGYTLEEILSKYKEEINICDIFGFVEVNHSAFLAYLFNRNETHGEGNLFFKIFLKEIGVPEGYAEEDYIVEREAQLDTEDKQNNSGKRSKNKSRVDIRIYCKGKFIINIEVKVGSPLNKQQIKAEDEDLESKAKDWNISDKDRFGIFISLLKEDKERFKDCNCNWISVEWSTIAECLDEFLNKTKNERIGEIVEEYLKYINENVLLTLNDWDKDILSKWEELNKVDKLEYWKEKIISKLNEKIKNLTNQIITGLSKKDWFKNFYVIKSRKDKVYIRKKDWKKGKGKWDGVAFGVEYISLGGILEISKKFNDHEKGKLQVSFVLGPISEENRDKEKYKEYIIENFFEKIGFENPTSKEENYGKNFTIRVFKELYDEKSEQKEWIDSIRNSTFVEKILSIFDKFSDVIDSIDTWIEEPELKKLWLQRDK